MIGRLCRLAATMACIGMSWAGFNAPGLAAQAAGSAAQAGDTSHIERDSVVLATREYRERGTARTIVEGNFITFPYGHSQPTLTCTVLRACVIQLEPGEVVLSKITGDTERWEVTPATAGPDGRTALVVVKPRDCDLTTNLVLSTDRRLYDLTLDAPPCKTRSTNPQQTYARHIRFYYPDETVVEWEKPAPVRLAPDVAAIDFGYRVKRDKQFPWTPAQIFDDGARVYIRVPEEARHGEAPALFVFEADGSKTLLNYTLAGGDTYVTDRLFQRAMLVMGVDGKERRVVIEREDKGHR